MRVYLLMGEWVDANGIVGSSIIHHAFLSETKANEECDRRNKLEKKPATGKFFYYVADVPLEE